MRPGFQPQTYEQWLSELKFQNEFADMIKTAHHIAKIAPDRKRAQIDVVLVLVEKYRVDSQRSNNAMVQRVVEQDYNKIAEVLFKCKMSDLIRYAQQHEPNLSQHTRVGEVAVRKGPKNEVKRPLGFLHSESSVGDDGKERPPLGFIKKPTAKVDSQTGRTNPSLGFLAND